jgi:1,4-alpha-glucan branching enzyme
MLKKNYTKTGKFCRVTFKVPSNVGSEAVALCGEFNGWNTHATSMKHRKDGSFSITVTLPANNDYRFKYYLDDDRWENDYHADAYVKNEFGSEDSIVKI